MALFASSYIPTVAAAVTRSADSLRFSFGFQPEAMTIYVRFVEAGTVSVVNGGVLVVSDTVNPQFLIQSNGTVYTALWSDSGGVTVNSSLGAGPTIGQGVELLVTIAANGAIQISQSINGGVISVAAASAAKNLPQSWGAGRLTVNDGGGGGTVATGFNPLRNVLILRGVQSFATMRRLAGVA